jgi:lactococcin 972 family bacteriocin
MPRRLTRLAIVPVAAALVLGAAGTATAVTEKVGGGTWYHGITITNVYSTYDNDIRTHRASVTTSAQYIDSGWKQAGIRAKASAQASLTGNKANYDFIK